MEETASVNVIRIGLKWAVEYAAPGYIPMTTEVSFWRKKSAQDMAYTITAAFDDGFAIGLKRGSGA